MVVRAPLYLSDEEIRLELEEHQLWIVKKIGELEERRKLLEEYRGRGVFMLLGRELAVKFADGNRIRVYGQEITIGRKANINAFLKKELSRIVDDLIEVWSHEGVPKGITYRRQKTIWGSCTIDGRINLNINLVKAPVEIIEYIYVHELVHLKIRNHSRQYWQKVESLLPDYKKHRKWLKDNGNLISLDFMVE